MDFLAREYESYRIPEKLFGGDVIPAIQRAVEHAGVLDLDTMLLTGEVPYADVQTYAALLPEYHACNAELFEAAERAAATFAANGRAAYYLERSIRKNGNPAPEHFTGVIDELDRSLAQFQVRAIDHGYIRDALLLRFRIRLWGEILAQYHAAIGNDPWRERSFFANSEALKERRRALERDPAALARSTSKDHATLLGPSDLSAVRNTRLYYPGVPEAVPLRTMEASQRAEILEYSMWNAYPQNTVLFDDATCRIRTYAIDPDTHRDILASTAVLVIVELWREGERAKNPTMPTFYTSLNLDRSTHAFLHSASLLPLARTWPELHARLEPLLIDVLHRALPPEDPVMPTFDWRAYRQEQLATREALTQTVPGVVDSTAQRKRIQWPAVDGGAAANALTRLLGPPIRIHGSHHVYRGRSGTCFPIPVHRGETIGIGLLRTCLETYGIAPDEFLAAL